jgi:hypothetical protein
MWLALDLAIPPLSLLVTTHMALSLVAAIAWCWGASALPLAILLGNLALLGMAVVLGWAAYCREQVSVVALFAIPVYVVMKLPIYLAFLLRRQQQWVRTAREIART